MGEVRKNTINIAYVIFLSKMFNYIFVSLEKVVQPFQDLVTVMLINISFGLFCTAACD